MFKAPPDKVIWFYGIYQKLFQEISDMIFVEKLSFDYRKYLNNFLMILHDLMAECARGERLTALFTKESHYLNLINIFITKNLF